MTELKLADHIDWDGSALCFNTELESGQVRLRVPRDTVHTIRYYSDAIEREILIDRFLIVETLAPYLRAKLSMAKAGDTLELLPIDVLA